MLILVFNCSVDISDLRPISTIKQWTKAVICIMYSCTMENNGHLKFLHIPETQLYQEHGTDMQWSQSTRTKLYVFVGGRFWPLCCDCLICVSDNKEEG